MSEPVTTLNDGITTRPSRRPWAGSEMVSWLVIALAICLIFGTPIVLQTRAPEKLERASEFQPGIQTLLGGRYLVGLNTLYSLKPTRQDETALSAMEQAAGGPFEKFRVAMVRGEVQGKEAAIEAAEPLAAQNDAVGKDLETLRALYDDQPLESIKGWSSFRERHGWFADLAHSNGKPAGDPLRKNVLNEAIRTMVTLLAMVLITLALGVIGLPLLIIGTVLLFKRRIVPAFDRTMKLPPDRRAYVQAVAFYLGIVAGVASAIRAYAWLRPQDAWLGQWTSLLLPIGFLLGFLWPLLRGQRWRELRATLGLHTGRGIFREMFCGAVGYVAGIPIFAVGVAITFVLTKLSGLDPSHPIVNQVSGDPLRIAIIFALASIFAPVTEELMFRGALFGHLRERFGFWISALAVAFIFAIIHPQGWPAIPALGSLAVVFAGIREWRGSILGPITAHAINNTAVLIVLTLMLS